MLVARWEDSQTADPYASAVLTAALSMARLGARALLSADLLDRVEARGVSGQLDDGQPVMVRLGNLAPGR